MENWFKIWTISTFHGRPPLRASCLGILLTSIPIFVSRCSKPISCTDAVYTTFSPPRNPPHSPCRRLILAAPPPKGERERAEPRTPYRAPSPAPSPAVRLRRCGTPLAAAVQSSIPCSFHHKCFQWFTIIQNTFFPSPIKNIKKGKNSFLVFFARFQCAKHFYNVFNQFF